MTDNGANDPTELPDFAKGAINLASPRLGSEAIFATDDFFAPKERMLQDHDAVWVADKYDDNGKWMDGWESRRRRDGGRDYCIVKLGVGGLIRGVDIDTSYFTGNFPPAASIEALYSETAPGDDAAWTEIVAPTTLGASAHHFIAVESEQTYNYLRLHMYPDGGIARLRVYGEPVVDWSKGSGEIVELSAITSGGRIIGFNNSHYGDPWVILTEGRGVNMGDGWETRRRREPGNDWIIVQLGCPGIVEKIEVDTAHFKGNYPDQCSMQAAMMDGGTDASTITQAMFWPELLAPQKLQMDNIHTWQGSDIAALGPVSHVKLNSIPDGGISRLRIFGKPA